MKIDTFMDGNSWVAVDGDTFRNLAESDAGFGETEQEAIQDLKETMGIDEDDTTELNELVEHYNEHMSSSTMEWLELDQNFYGLLIDGASITEGDLNDLITRIKDINRENGLNHLR